MSSNLELAILSEGVYHDVSKLRNGNWQRRTPSRLRQAKGFFFAEYINMITGQRVVAFRGTEPTDWHDLIADAGIILKNKKGSGSLFHLKNQLIFLCVLL